MFFHKNPAKCIICVLKPGNDSVGGRFFHCGGDALLAVVYRGGDTAVRFCDAGHFAVGIIGVGRHSACPVCDGGECVVGVVSVEDCGIVGINHLGKIAGGVILILDHLAERIGIFCDSVQRVVFPRYRAVPVCDGEDVADGVVGIADGILRADITRDSAHCVIEILPELSPRIGQLPFHIQFVVAVGDRPARRGALGNKKTTALKKSSRKMGITFTEKTMLFQFLCGN